MFHFILVLATKIVAFLKGQTIPIIFAHTLIHCVITVDLKSPATSDRIVLNLTHFTSNPPENMRNKTYQAPVEWPKGPSHRYTTAIQIRMQNIDSPSVLTY